MSTQISQTNLGIRLRDILPDAQIIGAEDIFFRSCCGVWQECQTDDLFVAIVDVEQDGHDFTNEAVRHGAAAVVTERLLSTSRPQCIVSDTREAYGRICQALAGHPSQRITTVGVGGSDGKTVTSHLIRSVFQAAELNTGLVSSIEVDCGGDRQSVPAKKHSPPRLAEQLAQMVMADCQAAVIEVPSVDLARRCLSGIDLDVAVVTNIRQDYLRFHGSTQNYRRAILRLLEQLKTVGLAVLNADDPTTHFLISRIQKPALTIGLKQEADVTAKVIERTASEQTFVINAGLESVPVRTTTVGDQHVYNCLAAAAVGLASGLELATIAKGLEQANNIPGRLERVECGQEFGVYVDSASNPGQLATALRSLKQITKGKVWCVCSTDESQNSAFRQRMGEVTERAANTTVITRTTVDQAIDYELAHQVLDGFEKPERAHVIPNRFRAIEWTLQQAKPGDTVLVAGCGERPFALIGEHNWTITDRDVCQAWLYDHASLNPLDATAETDCCQLFNIDDYRN